MRKLSVALFRFVGFIGEGIRDGVKQFFTIPPCKVCEIRSEMFNQFRTDTRSRMQFLEQALASEKREKEALRLMLAKATRTEMSPIIDTPRDDRVKIHGISSPMKERMQAETDSRKRYWAEKAKQAEVVDSNVS